MRFDWQRLLTGPWIQNAKTDWCWDELLNKALDQHGVKRDGSYTAQIGPIRVWVRNWPYAYGSMYSPHRSELLPSKATRKRLKAMLHQHGLASLAAAVKGVSK